MNAERGSRASYRRGDRLGVAADNAYPERDAAGGCESMARAHPEQCGRLGMSWGVGPTWQREGLKQERGE